MPFARLVSLRESRIGEYLALSTALALLAGTSLELVVRDMLKELSALPAESADAMALRASAWLIGVATFLSVLTLLFAGALFHALRRAAAEACLPPSGPWRFGPVRRVSGPEAVKVARVGMGLAVAISMCGLALGGIGCWLAARVIACAAKNL